MCGRFTPATNGDFSTATSGDFLMATDNSALPSPAGFMPMETCRQEGICSIVFVARSAVAIVNGPLARRPRPELGERRSDGAERRERRQRHIGAAEPPNFERFVDGAEETLSDVCRGSRNGQQLERVEPPGRRGEHPRERDIVVRIGERS